ncbi:MAG: pantoate--beta-alanine ligase [Dehalococcoidia bacterium]
MDTIAGVREIRAQLQGSVGLVPTMGFLHEGHLSLVRAARAENDHVFVSIFVNPTQFGPSEDLATYPRDPERDLAMLEAEGVDYVFMPAVDEIYPKGFKAAVEVGPVTEPLEGASRPGHFRGVATVVLKLFNIVQPDRAYFGKKDAQQLVVIKKMVKDLDVPVEIRPQPTVREADGLAMSSRNTFLTTPKLRAAAHVLYEALEIARELWAEGERDVGVYYLKMLEHIAEEELARIDYISFADPETLEDLPRIEGPVLVSMAVRIGRTRLIDNITLGE